MVSNCHAKIPAAVEVTSTEFSTKTDGVAEPSKLAMATVLVNVVVYPPFDALPNTMGTLLAKQASLTHPGFEVLQLATREAHVTLLLLL